MVGYADESKAYRIWIPEERRVDIARDVKFVEATSEKSSKTTNKKLLTGAELMSEEGNVDILIRQQEQLSQRQR